MLNLLTQRVPKLEKTDLCFLTAVLLLKLARPCLDVEDSGVYTAVQEDDALHFCLFSEQLQNTFFF